MAQHADVMAQYMRQMGRGGYTAMDYFHDSVRINMNAKLGEKVGYAQPLNVDVDLNHRLQVVDLTNLKTNLKTEKDIIDLLKNTPPQAVMIEDGKVIVLPPDDINGIKHIPYGTQKGKKIANKKRRIVEDIANILQHSVLIDSSPNNKIGRSKSGMSANQRKSQNRKNTIVNYHNLLSAIRINGNYYAVRFVAEEKQGHLTVYPRTVYLYDIIMQKSSTTSRPTQSGNSQAVGQMTSNTAFDTISIKDILNGVKDGKGVLYVDNNGNGNYYTQTYNQSAWHGSPHDFDTFDLGAIGTGEGNQAHGWGLYFAKDKKVSDLYRRELSLIHDVDKGTLFKVDVPDTKTMIDEQQSLNILSKETKQSLNAAINALPEQEKEVFINEYTNSPLFNHYAKKEIDELGSKFNQLDTEYNLLKDKYLDKYIEGELNTITQRTINRLAEKYNIDLKALKENPDSIKDVKNQLDTMWFNAFTEYGMASKKYREIYWGKYKEDFSTLLNDSGINGRDFYLALSKALGGAKKASEHLNEYGVKGITYVGEQDGRCYVVFDDKAIKVIEKYNQSINGMTEIMKDGERIISIFKTADRSTFLHEMGHVFFDDIQKLASMENAPEQLVLDWNKLKEWSEWDDAQGADNTKAHEKFARGWEAYLREGKAPTKGLQRVFRMFSKWLTRIYRAVTRLGGLPPKEIQDIMARMIATQEDIDAYTKEQAIEQFESSKLFKQLDEAEQAKVQGYIADVGEMAKERVMKRYIKELESRPIKEWNDEKDSIKADIEKRLMEQYPIYKDHQRYNAFGKDALTNTRYGTLKELETAEREKTGFTFDEAVNQAMESAEQAFIEDNHIGKSNIEIAEEWLLASDGQMKLTEEEAKIIKSQTNRDLAKNWELLDRLNRLNPNSETIESDLEPIAKRIIGDNEKVAKELGVISKELDSAQDRIEKLKAQLQERINNVRAIRDSGVGVISDYMNRAKQELGDLTLSQASQYKKYQNQAIREGKRADRALAVNKLEEALQAKQLQLLNQARARVAFDNALRIKKLRTKLLDNLNRMTRPKNPIAIEPNMRYFYAHMAYQMGLTKYDGLEPVDGFNMNAVINALDPDADILGDKSITFLDPWIVQLFYGKTPMSFKNLTMSQLNTLEELMTGMYKNGRNAYEGSTILNDKGESITFDDAVDGILTEAIDTFGKINGNVFNAQNNQTGLEAVAGLINKGNLSLLKVETFLRRLGPDAVKYIYNPISRATQAFNERKEVSMRRLAKDVSSVYGKRELFNIRNKHMYDVGELRNLTKEQVIALALNWGTERNRQRAMETAKVTEVEMEKAFQEILTDKDWEFIIRTWDHINSFFTERSKVQEELYGNPLKKEEGITFTIGGRTIVGQYYPIVYNPEVNASISDKEVEDIAKTMVSSNAILGTGMSATKSRLDVVKDKSLLLDFDVISNAITESINHITMRKAVTDVNRLVANREFQNYIVEKFGMNSYQFLRTWVRDNWKDEAAKMDDVGKILMFLKHNATMAIMAGRASVAIQNALNIPVAVYRIGAGNVIRAVNHTGVGFYGHGTETYNNTRDFVVEQSIFMRERIQTLDKDLKKGLTIQGKGLRINDKNIGGYKFEKGAEIRDEINNMGFRLLTETDFALSVPVWKFAYDQKVAELQSKEGVSTEWINQQAIEAGDRAVRDIFGSGDVKDAASIQRSRSQWVQLFVPFYSYANTLYNIIAESWYIGKDKGDWMPFARVLWWGIISQAIGMTIYKAMTNGDDDDPESIAKSFAEEFVQQGTMGIPLVRDIATMGMKFILGERPYNKGNTVMGLSIFEKLWDTGQAISSDNKDIVDVGRSLSQVSNRVTGFSDTVTDAFWTLLRVGLTDTDAKIEDVFMSILLDKRLKTKKEKKKKK